MLKSVRPRSPESGARSRSLQQCPSQHHERDREVDHQPGDIDERRHERRRRRRRIESEALERESAAAIRSACPTARRRRATTPTVIATSSQCSVVHIGEQRRPQRNPQEADGAQNGAERQAGEDLAPHHAPPVAKLTSPSASARITSVAAWEPELPPLEMMSGTNKREDDGLRDLRLRRTPWRSP